MNHFTEISPYEITGNPFTMIDKDWMLVGAEAGGKQNAMTASWGGVGVLWYKPVSFCFVRPQRYTREFMDGSDYYSLSFFGEEKREMLSYFGKVSGRDEDKIEKSGLTVLPEKAPLFAESKLTLICRKLYVGNITPESILAAGIDEKVYPNKDYHKVYIGEIVKVLKAAE